MAAITPGIDLEHVHPIRSLLVPLDGSRLAEATIPIALVLGSRLRANVTLLHVLEHDAPDSVHGDAHLTTETEASDYLETVARRFADQSPMVETHVHPNPEHDVARSISAHADEFGVDLVLIANHGRGGLRERLFGNIAQQVIRRGATPVLLVPVVQPDAVEQPFDCRRIGVLVNGSTEAESVLPAAVSLARGLGAEIRLILAVPTAETLPGDRAAAGMLVPSTMRAILDMEESQRAEYLQSLGRSLTHTGVPNESSIVRGDPAPVALTEAERLDVDLLAIATHGRSGISGLWTGSFGAKVLGRFTRPLLLTQSP